MVVSMIGSVEQEIAAGIMDALVALGVGTAAFFSAAWLYAKLASLFGVHVSVKAAAWLIIRPLVFLFRHWGAPPGHVTEIEVRYAHRGQHRRFA